MTSAAGDSIGVVPPPRRCALGFWGGGANDGVCCCGYGLAFPGALCGGGGGYDETLDVRWPCVKGDGEFGKVVDDETEARDEACPGGPGYTCGDCS